MPFEFASAADLEVGETADLEICATILGEEGQPAVAKKNPTIAVCNSSFELIRNKAGPVGLFSTSS